MKDGMLGFTGMMVVKVVDWENVKCNQCKSKKVCRRLSISKGSEVCQVNLKLIPKRGRKKEISKEAASSAMLWSIAQHAEKE